LREGELGPHLTQCGQAEAYLRAKFRLDPFKRLAKVHERYRQTDRTGQHIDSIGRTVLQTVAQKRVHFMIFIVGVTLRATCQIQISRNKVVKIQQNL